MVKRTKLSTRFIVYACDRAVASCAEYIPLCAVYRGRYCDSTDWKIRTSSVSGAKSSLVSTPVNTGSGTYPNSCTMGATAFSRG